MRALLTITMLWLLGSLAMVQAQETYRAGVHYVVLPAPASTEEPDKIEVAELFSYSCGYCYAFEPIINEWKKDLPEDVHFRAVPALFGGEWNTYGRLFHTLDSLGKLDETHAVVFNAIHQERNQLKTQDSMLKLLEPYGIDEATFKKTWNSYGVNTQMEQGERLARAYRATGVPTLIVNGKYRIEGAMVGGFDEMLKVADYLVEQERKAL